ncbi:Serine/threonine-protein phosphatase 1 regulatory subunit 10 [Fasciola hepatica]|uniref:Serine/threonine-protein phosphatase 1 regulatory subunit 10 n=1 Tax=Fasciola hepatica TaxID=6192 RepID=A0A4E0S036_FASHE|nr:Serine/threonine-protein phosphatase 1 regulatory subunit 10 [Fasciola hepatica]
MLRDCLASRWTVEAHVGPTGHIRGCFDLRRNTVKIETFEKAMIEPDRLLEEYQSHLDDNGGILLDSIPHLLELMTSVNGKLVPKCISLCIISASSVDTQYQLCKCGVWDILLKWLQEALKEDNYAFLIELLNLYLKLPVRLEQLTQNVCPKLINSLTKRCDHEEIVKKWKSVISADSRRAVDHSELKRKKPENETKPESSQSDSLKDEKKRRRTVKVPPTTMRTAGVEEATETQPKSRSEVLSKRRPQELPIESFHQKITVTPTEPRKIAEIHESSSFINALTTVTSPVVRKKRKMPPIKLDPLIVNDAATTNNESLLTDQSEQDSSIEASPSPVPQGSKKSSLTSISLTFSADMKTKKRVSWAEEDKLQTFYYFELDESERVNVNRIPVEEIRRKELSMERQLFKRSADDFTISTEKWHSPLPLECIFLVEPGCKSVERQVQTERERYVLQAIYFTRDSVPTSPEEPDVEVMEQTTPVDIPLEDLTLLEPAIEGGQFQPEKLLVVQDTMGNTQMSLNPEVADLVKSLAANLTSVAPLSVASAITTARPTVPEIDAPVPNQLPNPRPSPNNLPPVVPAPRNDQALQHELWDVLEENYPDIKLQELSAERIRDLLEPLRDQLVARGIFQIPTGDVHVSPGAHHSPLRPPLCFNHPPTVPPNYHGPPPPNLVPVSHPDFLGPRPGPPIHNGFRGGIPPTPHGPLPHFLPPGPPPPFAHGPGPMRGPPPPPLSQGPPLGARPLPYARGTGRVRGTQPCKFFQQGHCRNGPACSFLHSSR